MLKSKKVEGSGKKGIGLGVIIFLIFFILKLTETGQVSHWSWWWVVSPLWIPIVLVISLIALIGVVYLLLLIFKR